MTTQAMTTAAPDAHLMEQVLVTGDLGKLSATERLSYYRRVCESLNLNPLTQPFQYIVLNGKMVLYAGRNCTDQLRSTRNVSVTIVARERLEDLYVVTARATMPDGRTDESVGAVVLTNLKGEALANAIMRSETKAKRRVTLSICGLSWADESEVSSIPNAQATAVDMETGEVIPIMTPQQAAGAALAERQQPQPAASGGGGDGATPAQVNAIFAIGRRELQWQEEDMDAYCRSLYGKAAGELSKREASELIDRLKTNPASVR